jgi:hypothetical protein
LLPLLPSVQILFDSFCGTNSFPIFASFAALRSNSPGFLSVRRNLARR